MAKPEHAVSISAHVQALQAVGGSGPSNLGQRDQVVASVGLGWPRAEHLSEGFRRLVGATSLGEEEINWHGCMQLVRRLQEENEAGTWLHASKQWATWL